jgi:3-oxoacid CoA-transferase A subunit
MINKVFSSFEEAVADIPDGAVIGIGNFAGPGGTPVNLVKALRDHGARSLTVVANSAGGIGLTLEFDDHKILFEAKQVKKVIATFPFSPSPSRPSPAEKQILAGEVELELVPQGTLAERLRAGGAGIPAFFTPTGVSTVVEEGKERRYFEGRSCLSRASIV